MRKFLLLLLVAVAVSTVASAQTLKFGRVNTQAIIELMPETDSAQVKIKARADLLQEQVDYMQAELKKKYAAFEKEAPTLQGVIAEQRRKDIVDLQQKLETFSQDAGQELEVIKNSLLQP
ncbi:MAG: OmpH family outer membrane protein, partial [Rikenellaceae bacterium]